MRSSSQPHFILPALPPHAASVLSRLHTSWRALFLHLISFMHQTSPFVTRFICSHRKFANRLQQTLSFVTIYFAGFPGLGDQCHTSFPRPCHRLMLTTPSTHLTRGFITGLIDHDALQTRLFQDDLKPPITCHAQAHYITPWATSLFTLGGL